MHFKSELAAAMSRLSGCVLEVMDEFAIASRLGQLSFCTDPYASLWPGRLYKK